ncbi:1-acyl-sn-glycerol-3-phosphate acyltransferase [Mycoplasmatota bacterium]|nr:1-acyl-sn-glycerol-3-phosphate acyltransferase [Mycoplasmatota bacterium]
MPKIIIVTFIILYVFYPLTWLNLLISILISIGIVFVYQVLEITLRGKYYMYLINKGKAVANEKIYKTMHLYGKLVNIILRMNVTVYNYERFDPNKAYLITPNHQSNIDATIMAETFKDPISFVAKIALSRIIVVRDWMKLSGCFFLDKNDMRSQIKVMKQVEGKLNQRNSFVIFPEGKRSFTPEMNEFKSGTFKMATKTKADILPVTINHAHKLKNNYPWRKTEIQVYIHDAISYETYQDMSTQEIATMVQKIVASKIDCD